MKRAVLLSVVFLVLLAGCIDDGPTPTARPTFIPTSTPTATPTTTATPAPTMGPMFIPTVTPIPGVPLYPCAMEYDSTICGYCDPADTYEGNPLAGYCAHCPGEYSCSTTDICGGVECVERDVTPTPTPTPDPSLFCSEEPGYHLCGYCNPLDTYEGNPVSDMCRYCEDGTTCEFDDICGEYECVDEEEEKCPESATPPGKIYCGYCDPDETDEDNPYAGQCRYCDEETEYCESAFVCLGESSVCKYLTEEMKTDRQCEDRPGYIKCGYCDPENPLASESKAGECMYCPEGTECWFQNICYAHTCIEVTPTPTPGPKVYYVTANQCIGPYSSYNFWDVDLGTCLTYAAMAQAYCSNTRWWCG